MPQNNTVELWHHLLPFKDGNHHKYDYGHALIYAAPKLTGATRLAATACARTGCGLVSVISPPQCADTYRASLPAHIIVREESETFNKNTVSAQLFGPGGTHIKPETQSKISTVFDADALQNLPPNLPPHYVLTPHMGEFKRCFPEVEGTPEEMADKAAKKLGCIIVLKGAETIIASPERTPIINRHSSPWLATAGTGDVLAGILTGLLAVSVPAFEAACAAVWLHGEASIKAGPYMVASDLESQLQNVLNSLG